MLWPIIYYDCLLRTIQYGIYSCLSRKKIIGQLYKPFIRFISFLKNTNININIYSRFHLRI